MKIPTPETFKDITREDITGANIAFGHMPLSDLKLLQTFLKLETDFPIPRIISELIERQSKIKTKPMSEKQYQAKANGYPCNSISSKKK